MLNACQICKLLNKYGKEIMWFLFACNGFTEQVDLNDGVEGAIEMNMVVSSAINGEYEPCG